MTFIEKEQPTKIFMSKVKQGQTFIIKRGQMNLTAYYMATNPIEDEDEELYNAVNLVDGSLENIADDELVEIVELEVREI